uniref:Uncharacterized protein n=1 Tax=Tanacetum cinerariifolium TaxID=118510 RepID=A0A6L2J5F3_TANCI|nr:hypothetical protein [Tanacetum cinerariifolium]
MDETDGSGSISPIWLIVDDNVVMDMDATMDNLEERISNLENVFAYLKNKKMLKRKENKPNKDENITKFEVVAKLNGFTSKPEKVTTHKVVTKNVQTKPFPAKSPVPIRNFILGLAAAHTWACIDSRLGSRKSAMDNSFTIGSIEEADNVKILQSCNLAMSFGGSVGSDNQMSVLIDILDMLHPKGRLFKSRGCLLFVCRDDIGSREFTIYEMMKGCSVWTIRPLGLDHIKSYMGPSPIKQSEGTMDQNQAQVKLVMVWRQQEGRKASRGHFHKIAEVH